MIRSIIRARRKRVLIDINTQQDLFLADGNACIRNHRRVLANIRRVMAWARHQKIPTVSTCQVYKNHNGLSEFSYCLDGTDGQKKLRYTLLKNHISFPAENNTDMPRNILKRYRQVIFHQRSFDPFNEPRIERLLTEIKASEFVLIGACAEDAVKATALGLLQRGKRVSVVVDAVGYHQLKESDMAFRKIKAKGAKLIETRKLAGTSHLRHARICKCKTCRKLSHKIPAETAISY